MFTLFCASTVYFTISCRHLPHVNRTIITTSKKYVAAKVPETPLKYELKAHSYFIAYRIHINKLSKISSKFMFTASSPVSNVAIISLLATFQTLITPDRSAVEQKVESQLNEALTTESYENCHDKSF